MIMSSKNINKHLILPNSVLLKITNYCVQSCLHCSQSSTSSRFDFLTKSSISVLLERLYEFGIRRIRITGGEPLYGRNFEKLLLKALEYKFEISLFTSLGFKLPKWFLENYVNKLKTILTSLYGIDEKSHDFITRRKGSFNLVINNIKIIAKTNILITVHIIANQKNLLDLPSIIDLAFEIGADRVKVVPVNLIGRAKENKLALLIKDSDWEEFKNLCDNKYKNFNYNIYVSYNSVPESEKNEFRFCPLKSNSPLYINEGGVVSPCCLLNGDEQDFLTPNIFSKTWKSEIFKMIYAVDQKRYNNLHKSTKYDDLKSAGKSFMRKQFNSLPCGHVCDNGFVPICPFIYKKYGL